MRVTVHLFTQDLRKDPRRILRRIFRHIVRMKTEILTEQTMQKSRLSAGYITICLFKNKITSPGTLIASRRGPWHSSFCAEIIPKGTRVLGTVPRYSPSGRLSGDLRPHTESCLEWSSHQKVILSPSSQRHSSIGRQAYALCLTPAMSTNQMNRRKEKECT